MSPTARTLAGLLCVCLSACEVNPRDREADIQHCHFNGYTAKIDLGVFCCSKLNGEDICLRPFEVTKHRRELWPQ